jgi:uncharacterized membrane protein
MKSQLIASLIAGGALFAVAYIIARKHAVALISALSIACVPVVWFGSFLYPISSNGLMLAIQAILLAAIAALALSAYFKTLKWTNSQSDHYKIVICLLLCNVINFAFIGFEKPIAKPSFIQEFITWFKPVALNKDSAGFKIDIQCKTQKECQAALVKMQLQIAAEKAQ